jgi:hypothetical protein
MILYVLVHGCRCRGFKDLKIERLKDFTMIEQFGLEVLEFGPEASGFRIGIYNPCILG